MRKFSTAFFLLLFVLNVRSQDHKLAGISGHRSFQNEIAARFNFLGLLDELDANISIGGEYSFQPNWSAGADVAYIFSGKYINDSRRTRGMILRPL